MTKPPITDELLQHAWRDVRRPGWGGFEASLADPVRGGLIRARAAQLAHGSTPAHRQQAPPRRWPLALRDGPPTIDAKRAAAGDTDFADTEDPDATQEQASPCPP